jgi:VWFA-related protein
MQTEHPNGLRWYPASAGLVMVLCLILLAALASLAEVSSQAGNAVESSPQTIWITATQKGHAVTDLKKEDLQLWLGKQEQPISALTFNPSRPLRLGLLIDMSGSRRAQWPGPEISLAGGFFRTVMQPGDQAFILYFNDALFVDADITSDPNDLDRGLAHLASLKPQGGTALYDAIAVACGKRESSGPAHRALVVITDGEDNSSMQTRDEATTIARKTGTQLYTVGIFVRPSRGEPILRQMVLSTGGAYFRTVNKPEMEAAFNSIAEILCAEYSLEFQPTTGKKRDRVKIKCTRPGIQIVSPEDY